MSLLTKHLLVLNSLVIFVTSIAYSDCNDLSLVVIRHGHAEHLLEGVRNSRLTSEPKHLTKLGVEQVVHTARAVGIKDSEIVGIFSSPLIRALETAAVFFRTLPHDRSTQRLELPIIEEAQELNLSDDTKRLDTVDIQDLRDLIHETPITTSAEIIERDFGLCEGSLFLRGKAEDCPNETDAFGASKALSIESNVQIETRVRAFLARLKDAYCQSSTAFTGKYIILSTHEAAAKQIVRELTGGSAEFHPADAKILKFGAKNQPR